MTNERVKDTKPQGFESGEADGLIGTVQEDMRSRVSWQWGEPRRNQVNAAESPGGPGISGTKWKVKMVTNLGRSLEDLFKKQVIPLIPSLYHQQK